MNNSDIIAIIAMLTSFIISVTSTWVSYFINKSNIQAKRSEIAFEKRLEAFREIVEKIGSIKNLLVRSGESNFKDLKADFENAYTDFSFTYRKNLVFLPPHINKNVAEYGRGIEMLIHDDYSYENINKFYEDHLKYESRIIADMQKFVGYI